MPSLCRHPRRPAGRRRRYKAGPAGRFAAAHGIPHTFRHPRSEALAWGQFDAVTNVTPDAAHHATTLPLLAAGKHVLCEKPLATNAAQAREMADAAARAGVVNMVNLTYRNVPALQQAARMVAGAPSARSGISRPATCKAG
jgi:predicted dehydrogenase